MAEAAPERIRLELIEPAKLAYRMEKADSVAVEAEDGELSILPGHASLLAALRIGMCAALEGGKRRVFAVAGGLLEVRDDRVRILTRAVEEDGDIDAERAQRARKRAERRLKKKAESLDVPRARAALARAMNRLRIVEGRSGRR